MTTPAYLATTNARDQALWGSNRPSLAKQSTALLVNRASHRPNNMNRSNQNKFRQIARPYLMSSSQGGQKNRNFINGLLQHTVYYCPQNFYTPQKLGQPPQPQFFQTANQHGAPSLSGQPATPADFTRDERKI